MQRFSASLAALSLNNEVPDSRRPDLSPTRFHSQKDVAKSKLRRGGHEQVVVSRMKTMEIIEISSDEDDVLDHRRPRSPLHFTGPFAQPDHVKKENPLDGHSKYAATDLPVPKSPQQPANRVKLHHRSGNERPHGLLLSEYVEPFNELRDHTITSKPLLRDYPKLQLSFPNKHKGDDRALMTFTKRNAEHGAILQPPREAKTQPQNTSKSNNCYPRGHKEPKPCPYYYDQKLELNMYRGPGHEQFPIVLGTVEGHKETCAEWDKEEEKAKQKRYKHPLLSFKSRRSSLNETLLPSTESSESADDSDPAPSRLPLHVDLEKENQCLAEILQVFPQIQHDFVRELYRQRHLGSFGLTNEQIATQIQLSGTLIAEIAEMKSFPRESERKRKLPAATTDATGTTIKYNKDQLKNHVYFQEATRLLATEFDHIPTHYIHKFVREKQSLLDAYNALTDIERDYYTSKHRPYSRTRDPRVVLEKKYQKNGFESRDGHLYVNLVNEFQAARQHQAREKDRVKKQKEDDDKEAENLDLSIAQGAIVECSCCFDDEVPMNRAVPCEGDVVHFFCNGCIERQAQSQVGAMKYEMLCMDTGGCKANLSGEGVAKAISIQLFDKLALNQQQAEITAAGIEGLEECPFCDFKAIHDQSIEANSLFGCQNPDCGKISCRKCGEESHLPRSCEEVKNDKGLSARHQVEEARSEAMMRTCPKCKVKIIKEYGCNKLVCTNCHTIICYVCKKDISGKGKDLGYDHFHRQGASCTLHDQPMEDRHQREADAAETAAIAKAKAEDAELDENTLRVEAHLNHEKVAPAAAPRFGGMPHPIQPIHAMQNIFPIGLFPAPLAAPPRPANLGNAHVPQPPNRQNLQQFDQQADLNLLQEWGLLHQQNMNLLHRNVHHNLHQFNQMRRPNADGLRVHAGPQEALFGMEPFHQQPIVHPPAGLYMNGQPIRHFHPQQQYPQFGQGN